MHLTVIWHFFFMSLLRAPVQYSTVLSTISHTFFLSYYFVSETLGPFRDREISIYLSYLSFHNTQLCTHRISYLENATKYVCLLVFFLAGRMPAKLSNDHEYPGLHFFKLWIVLIKLVWRFNTCNKKIQDIIRKIIYFTYWASLCFISKYIYLRLKETRGKIVISNY